MKGEETEIPDFGFFYPFDVVERIYWLWHASEFKIMPDEGGILDQDSRLLDDLALYRALFDIEYERVKKRKDGQQSVGRPAPVLSMDTMVRGE